MKMKLNLSGLFRLVFVAAVLLVLSACAGNYNTYTVPTAAKKTDKDVFVKKDDGNSEVRHIEKNDKIVPDEELVDKDNIGVDNSHREKMPPGALLTDAVLGKPYTIRGVTYWRLESVGKFTQTGIASWYGHEEHGKLTANGERFNMYAYTAAHKTLPLGTVVLVINLENRRYTVVRINDRGPHVEGRIIDLSMKGAKSIGIEDSGTARVRVIKISDRKPGQNGILSQKKIDELEEKFAGGLPTAKVAVKLDTKPIVSGISDKKAEVNIKEETENSSFKSAFAVQLGSFSDEINAEKTASDFGSSRIIRVKINGRLYYRVQVTGFNSRDKADEFAYSVAERFPGAFVAEMK